MALITVIMKIVAILSLVLACPLAAFVSNPQPTRHDDGAQSSMITRSAASNDDNVEYSRRFMLQDLSIASLGVASGLLLQHQAAIASGGATAGGAYLLSAKQRYNERVTAGIKSFLKLGPSLEAGSLTETQEYFSCDEPGCWADLKAAGYLLANAFRRSASTNPDSLPAVKAWKAFAKEVDGVEKSLKKKKAPVTLEAYKKAEGALDAYLEEVELPPSIEMRK